MPGWGDFQLLQIDAATEPYPDARPKTLNTSKRTIAPMVISISYIKKAILAASNLEGYDIKTSMYSLRNDLLCV